jgi:predicted exporter
MRNRVLLLGAWTALLLLLGGWIFATLKPQSDLSLFLPRGKTETQQLLLDELHQGRGTRLLLLGISGGDAEGRANISQGLAGILRSSDLFEQVLNGAPGDISIDTQLLQYRYLLLPPDELERSLSIDGLREAFKARLEALKSPLPNPFKSLISRDPTAAYAWVLKSGRPDTRISRSAGVWSSQKGEMAILLLMTREGGLAIERQTASVAEIRNAFDKLNPQGNYQLILSGPGAFALLSKQLIESESRQLSLLATGTILLLLLLAYRQIPYLLYAGLPLLSALLVATLLTHLLFGGLHGITLAFGITLLGVTLDYPLHLFSHLSANETAGRTMQRIWPTLRLGVVTTCLGYLVLLTTDFTGLRQLGVFTLTGLLTAALVSRYLLPRLLSTTAVPRQRTGRLLSFLAKRRWSPALMMTTITLLAGIILVANEKLWNDDVAVLSPLPASLIEQDRLLRKHLMAEESTQMLLLRNKELEQLLIDCESFQTQLKTAVSRQLLADASLPCDSLPSQTRQSQNQARIPPRAEMSQRLNQAQEGLPFRAGAFESFLDDLEASRSLTPLSYAELVQGPLRERMESMLRPLDQEWRALAPLRLVRSEEALMQSLKTAPSGIVYVNLRQETSQLISGFRQEIIGLVAFGVLTILAALWLGLRSLNHALGVLLPIAAAILATLALPPLLGEAMNLFHLISLMLVVGIAIDFSLFFSRQQGGEHERKDTLHALSLCALSTASVFAILGSSSIPVLHAIGQTVATGVALSYFSTYAFWHMPRNPFRDQS